MQKIQGSLGWGRTSTPPGVKYPLDNMAVFVMLGLLRLSPYSLLSAVLIYASAASATSRAQLLLVDDNPTTGYQYNTRVVFDLERPHKWMRAGPFVMHSQSRREQLALDLELTYIEGDCEKGIEVSVQTRRRAPGSPPSLLGHTRVAGVLLKPIGAGTHQYGVSWWNPRKERFIENPESSSLFVSAPITLPGLPATDEQIGQPVCSTSALF